MDLIRTNSFIVSLQREKVLFEGINNDSDEGEGDSERMVYGLPDSSEEEEIDPKIMQRMMKFDEGSDSEDEEEEKNQS
jgi:hypothetical protein